MAHGLKVYSDAGDLVLSSDSIGLHYVGLATPPVSPSPLPVNKDRLLAVYTVTMPSVDKTPVPFLELRSDRIASVQYVERTSAGALTWEIKCYVVDPSSQGSSTFGLFPSMNVHVFTQPSSTAGLHGLRVYTSSGAVAWDLAQKPAYIRSVAEFPQRTDRATWFQGDSIPLTNGVVTPLVMERSHGKDNVRKGAAGGHDDHVYGFTTDGVNLIRSRMFVSYENGEVGGSPYNPQPDFALPARSVFVLNLGDYV